MSGGDALAMLFFAMIFLRFVVNLLISIDHAYKQPPGPRSRAGPEALARAQGWTYRPTGPDPLDRFGTDYPFSIQPVQDVITGSYRGRRIWCFQGVTIDPPGGPGIPARPATGRMRAAAPAAPARAGRRGRTVLIAALASIALVAAGVTTAVVWSGPPGDELPEHVREVYPAGRGAITALAAGQLDGVPVVAVVRGGHLHMLDLATGDRLPTPQPVVSSVAIGEPAGTPIIVTSAGSVIRTWDLRTAEPLHELRGHTDSVESVALGELARTPIVVSASNRDHTLRLWDLTTGEQIGEPFGNLLDWDEGRALAVTEVDGLALVVDGYRGGLAVWNVAPGAEPVLDRRLSEGHTRELSAARMVAVDDLDGTPVALAGSGSGSLPGSDVVMAWDLTTGDRLAQLSPPGELGAPSAVALSELDGAPVAVVAYSLDAILVWDLATERPIHEPVTGHTDRVTQLAVARLDGGTVAVSTGQDGRVLVWPLAPPLATGTPTDR